LDQETREVAARPWDAFARRFGRPPELGARAPGRVNLIGEHTDYNDGLVLPCAIDRETIALAARRDEGRVRIHSESEGDERSFEIARVEEERAPRSPHWSDYAKGVVFALRERGLEPRGLDLYVSSRVPVGAGLSSSAALTVALATVFDLAEGWGLAARERAEIAHRAESHYLGIGSGILDQFASALGRRDHALLVDCRSREVRSVAMPRDRTCLLVADSGVRRALADADSGYRRRVRECRAAAQGAGVASLRDVPPNSLDALERTLEPCAYRRLRHVVRENERVRECCRALEAGDLERVGEILRAGHRSLRDDYEVSIPELDALCEIADETPGVYGSRLTGAGFGGCTLHLVDAARASEVAACVAEGFRVRFGRRAPIALVRTADGAGPLAPP
jgi:galactokinase